MKHGRRMKRESANSERRRKKACGRGERRKRERKSEKLKQSYIESIDLGTIFHVESEIKIHEYEAHTWTDGRARAPAPLIRRAQKLIHTIRKARLI